MIKLLANCLWRKVRGKRRERSKLGVSVQLLWFSFLLLWRWKVKNAEKDSDKQENHYHLLQKHHQALDLFVLIKCKKYGNYYYWITIGSLFLKYTLSFLFPCLKVQRIYFTKVIECDQEFAYLELFLLVLEVQLECRLRVSKWLSVRESLCKQKQKYIKTNLLQEPIWFEQTPYGRVNYILSLNPATENEPFIWLFQKVYW